MTCYFRHLQEIFKKADVHVSNENNRDIDRIIHNIVGVEYKNCAAAWREVKKQMVEDEEDLIVKLKQEWNRRQ